MLKPSCRKALGVRISPWPLFTSRGMGETCFKSGARSKCLVCHRYRISRRLNVGLNASMCDGHQLITYCGRTGVRLGLISPGCLDRYQSPQSVLLCLRTDGSHIRSRSAEIMESLREPLRGNACHYLLCDCAGSMTVFETVGRGSIPRRSTVQP